MIVAVFQVAIPLLWAGLVAGISFIETPLKFRAPGITRALGLGIGRLVFGALQKVEFVLGLLLAGVYVVRPPSLVRLVLFCVLGVLLLGQMFWLTPILNHRIDSILKGKPLPATYHHTLAILAEVVKLVVLLTLGIWSIVEQI